MAKKQKARPPEHWQDEPEERDFLAAADYPSLLFADRDVASMVEELRNAPAIRREANDLLRASRLKLLQEADPVVKKDMKKVAGERAALADPACPRPSCRAADRRRRLPPHLRELSPRR